MRSVTRGCVQAEQETLREAILEKGESGAGRTAAGGLVPARGQRRAQTEAQKGGPGRPANSRLPEQGQAWRETGGADTAGPGSTH